MNKYQKYYLKSTIGQLILFSIMSGLFYIIKYTRDYSILPLVVGFSMTIIGIINFFMASDYKEGDDQE